MRCHLQEFSMNRLLIGIALLSMTSIASAQTRSVFIEDLTSYELRDAMAAGKTSAILFAGGIEQNGPHMALIKHNLIARYVGGQIAERMGNALVYPIMPFSPAGDPVAKTGHMRFPGTVSISSEVFLGVMRQAAQSAAAAGFKNIFLMGDHGQGQSELRVAAESGMPTGARKACACTTCPTSTQRPASRLMPTSKRRTSSAAATPRWPRRRR
jgi:creatinine amidohydrolase